jgi:hypothetical protein
MLQLLVEREECTTNSQATKPFLAINVSDDEPEQSHPTDTATAAPSVTHFTSVSANEDRYRAFGASADPVAGEFTPGNSPFSDVGKRSADDRRLSASNDRGDQKAKRNNAATPDASDEFTDDLWRKRKRPSEMPLTDVCPNDDESSMASETVGTKRLRLADERESEYEDGRQSKDVITNRILATFDGIQHTPARSNPDCGDNSAVKIFDRHRDSVYPPLDAAERGVDVTTYGNGDGRTAWDERQIGDAPPNSGKRSSASLARRQSVGALATAESDGDVDDEDVDEETSRQQRGDVKTSDVDRARKSNRLSDAINRLLQTVGLECVVRFIAAHQRVADLPEHLRKQLLEQENMLFSNSSVTTGDRYGGDGGNENAGDPHMGLTADKTSSFTSSWTNEVLRVIKAGEEKNKSNDVYRRSVEKSDDTSHGRDGKRRSTPDTGLLSSEVERMAQWKNGFSGDRCETSANFSGSGINGLGLSPANLIGIPSTLGVDFGGLPPFSLGFVPPQLMTMMMMMASPPFAAGPKPVAGIPSLPHHPSGGHQVPPSSYGDPAILQLLAGTLSAKETLSAAAAAAAALASTTPIADDDDRRRQPTTSRRVRTRITSDQLAVLRARFDVSAGTPNDDELAAISAEAGLPPKVVKHWFRNTLFKERQRSKESPYNFAIPPTAAAVPLSAVAAPTVTADVGLSAPGSEAVSAVVDEDAGYRVDRGASTSHPDGVVACDYRVESEKAEIASSKLQPPGDERTPSTSSTAAKCRTSFFEDVSPHGGSSASISSELRTSAAAAALGGATVGEVRSTIASTTTAPLSVVAASANQMHQMSVLGQRQPQSQSTKPVIATIAGPHRQTQYQQQQQQHHGKRASRTHFTDDQVRVLHEHFERNAYPRDDELESLSRRLGLSARVIVVWFQNARQKARRTYENQNLASAASGAASGSSSMSHAAAPAAATTAHVARDVIRPTSGLHSQSGSSLSDEVCDGVGVAPLRYECRSCPAVFQRYYDLIKHQRMHVADQQQQQQQPVSLVPGATDQRRTAVADGASAMGGNLPFLAAATAANQCSRPCGVNIPAVLPPTMAAWPASAAAAADFSRLASILSPSVYGSLHSSMTSNKCPSTDRDSSSDDTGSSDENDSQSIAQQSALNLTSAAFRLPKADTETRVAVGEVIVNSGSSAIGMQDTQENATSREKWTDIAARGMESASAADDDRVLGFADGVVSNAKSVECLARRSPAEIVASRAKERRSSDAVPMHLKRVETASSGVLDTDDVYSSESDDEGSDNKCDAPTRLSLTPNASSAKRLTRDYGVEAVPRHLPVQAEVLSPNAIDQMHGANDLSIDTRISLQQLSSQTNEEAPLDLSRSHTSAGNVQAATGRLVSNVSATVNGRIAPMMATPLTASPSAAASAAALAGRASASSKRHRTHMTDHQVRVMRAIYAEHRTPSIGECATVGAKIGLARRVVQVWFQNARAKDKKKAAAAADGSSDEQRQQQQLADDEVGGIDADSTSSSSAAGSGGVVQCKWCGTVYAATRCAAREHLFSAEHVGAVDRIVRSTTAAVAANLTAAEEQRATSGGRTSKRDRRRGQVGHAQARQLAAGGSSKASAAVGDQMTSPTSSLSSSGAGGDPGAMSPSDLRHLVGGFHDWFVRTPTSP